MNRDGSSPRQPGTLRAERGRAAGRQSPPRKSADARQSGNTYPAIFQRTTCEGETGVRPNFSPMRMPDREAWMCVRASLGREVVSADKAPEAQPQSAPDTRPSSDQKPDGVRRAQSAIVAEKTQSEAVTAPPAECAKVPAKVVPDPPVPPPVELALAHQKPRQEHSTAAPAQPVAVNHQSPKPRGMVAFKGKRVVNRAPAPPCCAEEDEKPFFPQDQTSDPDCDGDPGIRGLLRYKKWWYYRKVAISVNGRLLTGTPIALQRRTLRVVNDSFSYFIPMKNVDYIRTTDGLRAARAEFPEPPSDCG